MQNKDVCETCKIYQDKKEELLRIHSSAFGAAADMWFFIDECSKTCIYKNENKTGV